MTRQQKRPRRLNLRYEGPATSGHSQEQDGCFQLGKNTPDFPKGSRLSPLFKDVVLILLNESEWAEGEDRQKSD